MASTIEKHVRTMPKHFLQIVGEKSKPQPSSGANATGTEPMEHDARPDDGAARQRAYELDFITKSGLFDNDYYLAQHPDIAQAGVNALEHFYDFGYREGRRPNLYFDPQWYLKQNPDVQAAE